jgi:hypothetical protein
MTPVPSVARVVDVFRADAVAAVCGVDASTVTAWAAGEAEPSPDVSGVLVELDALIDALDAAFTPAQQPLWLDGPNARLGAAPRAILATTGGIAAVRDAIAAWRQGAPD